MAAPTFPKRDPATAEFWDLRYAADFTPWDAGRVPLELREYVSGSPPLRVLVPGCGSAFDVRLFADNAWEVLGVDFSDAALEAARRVLGEHAGRVIHADFFGALPGEPFEVVYERAFLCALPRRLWDDWGRRVARLVAPGGELVGFFFIAEGERGPPFPLASQDELDALLAPAFDRIEDAPARGSIEVFAGHERWQRWRRR